ncbi:MAG: diguanylate cyclase [Planctomycetes bacterium]|nr:diguanylate cyclase [Planctomycetota bacterium]
MIGTCNILIIGSELECDKVLQVTPASLPGIKLPNHEEDIEINIETIIPNQSWEVSFSEKLYDLGIFFLTDEDAHLFLNNNTLLSRRTHSMLFVTNHEQSLPNDWQLRQHQDDVLIQPYTNNMLRMRIELLLLSRYQRTAKDIDQEEIISFLSDIVNDPLANRNIEPIYDNDHANGFYYPAIAQHFGLNIDDMGLLEHMVDQGLLGKRIVNRKRYCPKCRSSSLNFREVCPQCQSINFIQETVIHHFSCDHIDTIGRFRQGDELVCPKCTQTLRHIGLDYEKPMSNYRCHECEFIFANGEVQVECEFCQHQCPPQDTNEVKIFRYELLAFAEEAVLTSNIQGYDLQELLRSQHTGAYSKQFFMHEMQRDVARNRRYKTPCSIILVQMNFLEQLRKSVGEQSIVFIQQLFASISKSLRTLDVTSVLTTDTLGVLLPGTPIDGARIVAMRMEQRAQQLDFPIDEVESYLTTGSCECSEEIDSADALVAMAQADLEYNRSVMG